MTKNKLSLLVGDNPFHGISHLSQERARARYDGENQQNVDAATNLVKLSLQNGADGFMFSVAETTLSIIDNLRKDEVENLRLYAIAPYAFEYVRKPTQSGGVSGLARNLAKEMVLSPNVSVVARNLFGLLRLNPTALLKTYVAYELRRIRKAADHAAPLESFMLHEVVTDMALALGMEKLFKSYIGFLESSQVQAGFETRNFPYLVDKFREWKIDLGSLTLTSSFNKIGFQMCPSKDACEEALERADGAEVIAMSALAAGYLKPAEAVDYLASLRGLGGIVVGVSREKQAIETFRIFRG